MFDNWMLRRLFGFKREKVKGDWTKIAYREVT
jgi:hypothetical protein